jgi:hypothetical protein
MITICLDEVGHFELENNNSLRFVGGAVYTGDDCELEKGKLLDFLKQQCYLAGGSFPEDLHRNYKNDNYLFVKRVKERIANNLPNYLKRNGNYHITCMLKSKKDRNDFSRVSNVIDDSIASNLYEHMICGLIKNLLFYNINIDINNGVNLEIPTRLSVIPLDDTDKIEQFMRLGYRPSNRDFRYTGKKACGFFSTDEKTFKTSIATLIMNDKRRINVSFNKINVQSIDYNICSESMAFLYLADFLCDNIRSNIVVARKDHGIEGLHEWAKEVTGGNEPFLYAYDDIDSIHTQIMDKFYRKEFVDTLEQLYDACNFKSDYTEYYRKKWFKLILNNIDYVFDLGELDSYINKMDKRLKTDDVNVDRLCVSVK